MSGARIKLDDVRFGFKDWSVDFDIEIDAGQFVAVIGPSGGGKSTLLNLIAGFETPRSGRVLLDGKDVTGAAPAERPVSMLFQEHNLFHHLDVWTNVGLGLSPSMRLSGDDEATMRSALERVGLDGKERRLPGALSGGERQRVALARVLVRDRPILLLDEPFSALGPALKQDMLKLVAAIHGDRGMTVLMVTHTPDDARRIANHMAFVDGTRIAAFGETDVVLGLTDVPALTAYLGEGS